MKTLEKPTLVSSSMYFVEIYSNEGPDKYKSYYCNSFTDLDEARTNYDKLKQFWSFKTGQKLRFYKETVEIYEIFTY